MQREQFTFTFVHVFVCVNRAPVFERTFVREVSRADCQQLPVRLFLCLRLLDLYTILISLYAHLCLCVCVYVY